MDLLLRLEPLDIRFEELGFTLDYAGRAGASKMNVLRTIRSTVSLLMGRRWERLTRWRPEVIEARLAPMAPAPGAEVDAESAADARVETKPATERKSA